MTFDAKDKALIKASALVGYCESIKGQKFSDPEMLQNWFERLFDYADSTGIAISAALSPPITVPGVEK